MDYDSLLEGIKAHPYVTIFTASVIDGRLTAVAVGAFVAQEGHVNPIVAYLILVIMGILGDMLYYFIGRVGEMGGKFIIKKSWRNKISQLDGEWKNLPKAIVISKIIAGSKPVIVVAGMIKMSSLKFMGIIVPCTLLVNLAYMAVGYFFGQWVL